MNGFNKLIFFEKNIGQINAKGNIIDQLSINPFLKIKFMLNTFLYRKLIKIIMLQLVILDIILI